jgi:hypothetical protein
MALNPNELNKKDDMSNITNPINICPARVSLKYWYTFIKIQVTRMISITSIKVRVKNPNLKRVMRQS